MMLSSTKGRWVSREASSFYEVSTMDTAPTKTLAFDQWIKPRLLFYEVGGYTRLLVWVLYQDCWLCRWRLACGGRLE